MKPTQQRVSNKVDDLRDYNFKSLHELVSIPSMNHPPTGDEYECQMAVVRHWREMGLEPEIYALDTVTGLKEHPRYWPGRDDTDRPNVIVRRIGHGGGKSRLLLAAPSQLQLAARCSKPEYSSRLSRSNPD